MVRARLLRRMAAGVAAIGAALVGLTGVAAADAIYLRADADARLAIGTLDLAEQAGDEPGGASDLGPGMVGLSAGLGLDTGSVAIGVEAGIYVGGLALDRIEERYFGAPSSVGSSATLLLGLAGTYRRPLREAVDLTGRVGFGYSRLAASSPAGNARVDTLYLDIGGGLAYELGGRLRGRVEVGAALRLHRMHRFAVTGLTPGRIAADQPAVFAYPGLQLGYQIRF